jgi:2-polyprenyl-3-methyl-5-hydroxy-6-metoxy-1,4-benzoquinol methylase
MTESKKYLYDITDNPNHSASKIIALLEPRQEVLEVGCASGSQTRFLKETLACRVTGIEIDKLAAEDARPYCENLIIGNIENLDLSMKLGDKRFDVITFADVLEHLYEPTEALKKVRPFIKEGGYLIASIPNIAHAAVCWELAHGRFDYQKYGLLDNTHIRFFTKKNVAKLFGDAGYRITSWDRVTKLPQETEFNVHYGSDRDQAFLEWIERSNPEANTYQFIVKAQPVFVDEQPAEYQQLDALDTIKKLEGKIGELNKQNMALKSQINWLENHRWGPFSSLFKKPHNKT